LSEEIIRMENRYEDLEMEIIAFAMEDVIVTSVNCDSEMPGQPINNP
jgi:hypothetical protein